MSSASFEIFSYVLVEILVLVTTLFLILRKRITLVLASDSLLTGLPAVVAGMVTRTPVTIYLAGDIVGVLSYKAESMQVPLLIRRIIVPLASRLCRLTLQKSSSVLAVNPKLQRLAKLSGAKEVVLCLNPVDSEMFKPSQRSNKKIVKIVCVARLSAEKGIDYLLRAFKTICTKNGFVRLAIVGDGPLRSFLEKEIKDLQIETKVNFLGKIKYSKMPEVYNSSDIFVLPSLSEGLSIALLEALSSGLPVVTSNVGGIESIVENGKQGIIVPPRNERRLTEALELLINDADQRKRMGNEGRKLILTMFSQGIYYQKLINTISRYRT